MVGAGQVENSVGPVELDEKAKLKAQLANLEALQKQAAVELKEVEGRGAILCEHSPHAGAQAIFCLGFSLRSVWPHILALRRLTSWLRNTRRSQRGWLRNKRRSQSCWLRERTRS